MGLARRSFKYNIIENENIIIHFNVLTNMCDIFEI